MWDPYPISYSDSDKKMLLLGVLFKALLIFSGCRHLQEKLVEHPASGIEPSLLTQTISNSLEMEHVPYIRLERIFFVFIIDVLAVSSYHQLIILYLKIVMASSDVLKSGRFPATNHTLLKRGVNSWHTLRLEIWFLIPEFRGMYWWDGSCALPALVSWAVFLKKRQKCCRDISIFEKC